MSLLFQFANLSRVPVVNVLAVELMSPLFFFRGAHTFFLRQGQVSRWGGYTVNLIHYEDAASLCVAVSPA